MQPVTAGRSAGPLPLHSWNTCMPARSMARTCIGHRERGDTSARAAPSVGCDPPLRLRPLFGGLPGDGQGSGYVSICPCESKQYRYILARGLTPWSSRSSRRSCTQVRRRGQTVLVGPMLVHDGRYNTSHVRPLDLGSGRSCDHTYEDAALTAQSIEYASDDSADVLCDIV